MPRQTMPRSPRFQTAHVSTAEAAGPSTPAPTFRARPPVKRLPPEDTMTKGEAARHAKVSQRTINRWMAQGSLNRYVIRVNLVAVSRKELDALLTARHEA